MDAQPTACWGTVKWYNPAKGFGFIVSESVEGDIIFGANDLPVQLHQNTKNVAAIFEPSQMDKGIRAQNCRFVLMAEGASVPSTWGTVKFFNGQKGFGFIQDAAQQGEQGDVIFGVSDIHPLLRGARLNGWEVGYDVTQTEKGTRASNLAFVVPNQPQVTNGGGASGGGAYVAGGCGFGGGCNGFAPSASPGAQPTTDNLSGTVASFNPGKGFGFVSCPAIGGDAYFKAEHVSGMPPQLCVPGTQVVFDLTYVGGKAQGRNLRLDDASTGFPMAGDKRPPPGMPAPPPPAKRQATGIPPVPVPGAQNMCGTVASFSAMKGFGFIKCAELGGDAYFKAEQIVGVGPESCVPGMEVVFDLQFMQDKPQARNVRPTGGMSVESMGMTMSGFPNVPQPPMPPSQQQQQQQQFVQQVAPVSAEMLTGTVKAWTPGKFGFIVAPGVQGDVWVGCVSLAPGCPEPAPGSQVSFQLIVRPDGRYSAAQGSVSLAE